MCHSVEYWRTLRCAIMMRTRGFQQPHEPLQMIHEVINLVSHRVVKADRTGSNSMSFARLCFQSFYSQCGHLKSCIQVFRSPIYLYRKNTKIQIRSRTSWGICYTFVFIILYLSRWDLNLISKKGLANRAAKANTTHNNITSKKQILYCIQTSEHKRVNNTK